MAPKTLVVSGWNSVSDDQKAEIKSILENSGLLAPTAEITADPAKPEFGAAEVGLTPESIWGDIKKGACKVACDTAASAAAAACTGLSGGVAIAACIAAAAAAREVCRDHC
jgi:hypothetical protein